MLRHGMRYNIRRPKLSCMTSCPRRSSTSLGDGKKEKEKYEDYCSGFNELSPKEYFFYPRCHWSSFISHSSYGKGGMILKSLLLGQIKFKPSKRSQSRYRKSSGLLSLAAIGQNTTIFTNFFHPRYHDIPSASDNIYYVARFNML